MKWNISFPLCSDGLIHNRYRVSMTNSTDKKQSFKPFDEDFFVHSALDVAQGLVGAVIRTDEIELEILETEAYMPNDTACHAHKGKTQRTAPMFEKGGCVYVYLCYGIHILCNVVTGEKDSGQAVLIRAARVISGEEIVKQRRKGRLDLIGPGKVGQALGLSVQDSGKKLGDCFEIYPSQKDHIDVKTDKRVGIDYAKPQDRDALWRFILVDS